MSARADILCDGLVWPESPRWRDGKLWISEAFAGESGVRVLDADGTLEQHFLVSGGPAGMDFLSDGSLVIALAFDRKLKVLAPGTDAFQDFLDLSSIARYPNELIVGQDDIIIVSDSAFQVGQDAFHPGQIVVVDTERNTSVIWDGLAFPNGLTLASDGRSLVVAETFAARLSCFDFDASPKLSKRRELIAFDDLGTVTDTAKIFERTVAPDGICRDGNGNIWVANPLQAEVLCVSHSGEIVDTVTVSQGGIACMIGGPDNRTLYVTTGDASDMTGKNGRVEAVKVGTP